MCCVLETHVCLVTVTLVSTRVNKLCQLLAVCRLQPHMSHAVPCSIVLLHTYCHRKVPEASLALAPWVTCPIFYLIHFIRQITSCVLSVSASVIASQKCEPLSTKWSGPFTSVNTSNCSYVKDSQQFLNFAPKII